MPSIDIATPVSSAPINRLALGVGWVRPGAAAIGHNLNPCSGLCTVYCFEGSDE